MSVAIATMGKYIPAVGGQIIEEVVVQGSTGGIIERKPKVIVDEIFDEEERINISVVLVKEK